MNQTVGCPSRPIVTSTLPDGIRREIFRLIWPVTLESILQMAVGLVAMGMVGRLGATAIASVGLVNRLTQLIWALYAAIGTGTTVLVARSVGAADFVEGRDLARTALRMSALFTLCTTLPLYAFPSGALMVFAPQPDLLAAASGYFRISIWSVPFMVLTLLTSSVLRGKGDTRTPMLIAFGINILNIGLQYTLIFGKAGLPAMGLNGSALAIVIAQAAGAVTALIALFRSFWPLHLLSRSDEDAAHIDGAKDPGLRIRPGKSRRILKVGIPAAMELVCWQIAAFILTRMIVGFGRVPMAAHQLGLQAEAISYMPAAGFSIAATALVGQSLGAGAPDLARRYIREIIRWAIGITILAAAVLLFLPKPFLSLLTNDRRVINLAAIYLMLMAVGQSPQNIANVFNGALRGSGDTRTPMIIAFAGLWLVRLPLAFVLGRHMGVVGVWIAITADLFVRFGLSLWRFLLGRWHGAKSTTEARDCTGQI